MESNMRFNILSDTFWESKVEEALEELLKLEYFEYFREKFYGEGLLGVTVLFMCQDPSLNLKRRIRLSKVERKLYLDIMLDLPTMKAADPLSRKRIIANLLRKEVPEVISKYKISDFDSSRFIADLDKWVESTGWL
jgi:hypothetical protein